METNGLINILQPIPSYFRIELYVRGRNQGKESVLLPVDGEEALVDDVPIFMCMGINYKRYRLYASRIVSDR